MFVDACPADAIAGTTEKGKRGSAAVPLHVNGTRKELIMKRFSIALIALSLLSAYANAAGWKEIIEKKHSDLLAGNVADYRLAWGTPDPAIEKIIAAAQKNVANTTGFLTAIEAGKSGNLFAGANQSCAEAIVMDNNGGYISSRSCATEYDNRAWVQANLYNQGYVHTATVGNVDFGYYSATMTPFTIFFTASGYASEFQWLYNYTY